MPHTRFPRGGTRRRDAITLQGRHPSIVPFGSRDGMRTEPRTNVHEAPSTDRGTRSSGKGECDARANRLSTAAILAWERPTRGPLHRRSSARKVRHEMRSGGDRGPAPWPKRPLYGGAAIVLAAAWRRTHRSGPRPPAARGTYRRFRTTPTTTPRISTRSTTTGSSASFAG